MKPPKTCVVLLALAFLLTACDDGGLVDPSTEPGAGALSRRSLETPYSTATTVSGTQIDVAWQDNSRNESGFEVHRSTNGEAGPFTLLITTTANVVAHSDQFLAPGTQYCYQIRAVRVNGSNVTQSEFSNAACATTTTPTDPPAGALEPPSNVTAVLVSPSEINVGWQDNSSSESGFQIYAYSAFVGTSAANTTSYTHSGLTPYTSYCYQVRAFRVTENDTTYSDFSPREVVYGPYGNAICAVTPLAPATSVTSVTAQPNSSTSVVVSWGGSSNATDYRVYRSADAGASWTLVTSVWYGNYLQVLDEPVSQEHQVCYRVVASNDLGDAPPSPTTCTAPPAAPTGLASVPIDAETIELTWSDNSAVEDGYQVWFSLGYGSCSCGSSACDADWYGYQEVVAQLPANTTSYRAPALYGDVCRPTTTSYYVVATKDGGVSSPSNWLTWSP